MALGRRLRSLGMSKEEGRKSLIITIGKIMRSMGTA
jgi:hypothetical protein